MNQIPGTLILSSGIQYGRANGKRLLYKFVPNDSRLLHFLVPYEMKKLEFIKVVKDIYCTIIQEDGDCIDKHPRGLLSMVIGDISIERNFFIYRTLCRKLDYPISQLQKQVKLIMENYGGSSKFINRLLTLPFVVDRRYMKVFTIDPEDCKDYDDAFSISLLKQNEQNIYTICVYISNVPVVIDQMAIWDKITKRVATIYLPDSKIPMLPCILSEGACSLKEKMDRIAMCLEFTIINGIVINTNIVPCCFIQVYKNYVYESNKLLKDKNYVMLANVTAAVSALAPYLEDVSDSHKLVSFWMIFMNHYCAQLLKRANCGVCRTQQNGAYNNAPPHLKYVLERVAAKSSAMADTTDTSHSSLRLEVYCNITSPIRRLTDVINMAQLCNNILTPAASTFYTTFMLDLDRVNSDAHQIRKLQNECLLLHVCENACIHRIYDAYVLDSNMKQIYICDLEYIGKVECEVHLVDYEVIHVKLFIFVDEVTLSKKIRFQKHHTC